MAQEVIPVIPVKTAHQVQVAQLDLKERLVNLAPLAMKDLMDQMVLAVELETPDQMEIQDPEEIRAHLDQADQLDLLAIVGTKEIREIQDQQAGQGHQALLALLALQGTKVAQDLMEMLDQQV